jgi:integrase
MVIALKDVEIRALKAADRIYKRTDDRGLYIEVHPSGSKLWRLKYRHLGKDKRLAFGAYPEVGLAEARRRRDDARQQLRDGIDPAAERRREKLLAMYKAANSFGDVAKEYIDKMVNEGRADTTTSKANWLLEQLSPLARQAIADLKPIDVLAALKRIEAKGKHETARRCRSFASRVFRYAVATGRAEVDPTSVLRGALVSPKVKHHSAIIDPGAVGELLRSIDSYSGHLITRIAMQISPHVMCRPGELRQAEWQEFDLERAVWTIPPERMKMRRPHSVPLSRQVVDRLKELHALTGPAGYEIPHAERLAAAALERDCTASAICPLTLVVRQVIPQIIAINGAAPQGLRVWRKPRNDGSVNQAGLWKFAGNQALTRFREAP